MNKISKNCGVAIVLRAPYRTTFGSAPTGFHAGWYCCYFCYTFSIVGSGIIEPCLTLLRLVALSTDILHWYFALSASV